MIVGHAEHGQLKMPRGELLRSERVALGGGERRVDLVVGGAEERGYRVGVEGGVETRAGLARSDGHGRGAYQIEGTTLVPAGATTKEIPVLGLDAGMYARILQGIIRPCLI